MVSAAKGTSRNVTILGATAVTVVVIFLYPTSTNRGTSVNRPGQVARAGIVVASPGASAAQGGGGASTAPVVVNDAAADTPYGPVQVQRQISGGAITSATAIDFPQSGGRDREINGYAIPILQGEAVAVQSAHIDTVSGATFPSHGYIQPLQSALDSAHLK